MEGIESGIYFNPYLSILFIPIHLTVHSNPPLPPSFLILGPHWTDAGTSFGEAGLSNLQHLQIGTVRKGPTRNHPARRAFGVKVRKFLI